MNLKRIISGLILFPILAIILIFGNKYIVDVFISIISIMSIHEFYKAFEGKANPIKWTRLCYISTYMFYTFGSTRICT